MRRFALAVPVAVTALFFAHLLPANADSGDLVDRYEQLDATGLVHLTADGRTVVGDITGTENIVNAAGDLIDRVPFKAATQVSDRPLGQSIARVPCVQDTNREGFTAYIPPVTYDINKKNEKGTFRYNFYSQDSARTNAYGDPTVQFLGCGVGGVDAGNGSRITISGPGMAFNDSAHSYVLGTRWKEGKTPEDYSITLGFEVPVRGVNITGSIQQSPSNYLKGSISPPYNHFMKDFHGNATNGWWEDGCRPRCTRFGGSNNYQGSVAEGLWEFPQAAKGTVLDRGFQFAAYMEHFCSNPFGC